MLTLPLTAQGRTGALCEFCRPEPPRGRPRPRFYVQFPAGLVSLVQACLEEDVQARVEAHDDSSAVFMSSAPPQAIAALPYLKNTFRVVGSQPRRSLDAALRGFASAIAGGSVTLPEAAFGRPFRVMAHVDGRLVSLPKQSRSKLENVISSETRSQVEARGSGEEYWIVGRRDMDQYLLGHRLATRRSKTREPAGSLSAELADLLVRMSAPSATDTFLDPFAGSDALATARSRYPAERILSSELQRDRLDKAAHDDHITLLSEDASQLPSVGDDDVDVIVTDPPWGEHDDVGDHTEFLARMWKGFGRVLVSEGCRAVVLMTRDRVRALVETARPAGFEAVTSHELLVNGHPATAVVFERHADIAG
jgi:predicted RNA methylase